MEETGFYKTNDGEHNAAKPGEHEKIEKSHARTRPRISKLLKEEKGFCPIKISEELRRGD